MHCFHFARIYLSILYFKIKDAFVLSELNNLFSLYIRNVFCIRKTLCIIVLYGGDTYLAKSLRDIFHIIKVVFSNGLKRHTYSSVIRSLFGALKLVFSESDLFFLSVKNNAEGR